MADVTFEIDFTGNGLQIVNPPANWKGLMIEVMFSAQSRKPFLSLGLLEWVEKNCIDLKARKDRAKTTGPSIYVGVPLRMTICDMTGTYVFDGYINLADGQCRFECDMIKAPCVETGRVDWFNDNASSANYAYLREIGIINPATDYKLLPYTIVDLPHYTQAALLLFSSFGMADKIAEVTETIAELIDRLTGDATTAAAQLGTSVANVIATIAIIVLYVAYLFLLIALMVKLMLDLIDNIVQKKKYKLCMREADLFIKGLQYLGLTFVSNIYGVNEPAKYGGIFADATYVPKKSLMLNSLNDWRSFFKRPVNEADGFPNNGNVYGYFDDGGGTIREFVESMCRKYNAEWTIIGNKFYFREKHDFNFTNAYQLPNTSDVGFVTNLPDPHGTNATELPSQYLIAFNTDVSNLVTLHRYTGTTVEVSVLPNTIPNQRQLSHGTPVYVQLTEALAKRKESLTIVEKLLDDIINPVFNFVNGVIGLLNGLLNLVTTIINLFGGNAPSLGNIPYLPTNIFAGRIGWAEFSNDTFSVPHTFIGIQVGTDWEIHQGSEQWMSAISLFNNLHKYNLATHGAQAETYENHTVPFCCADFKNIITANVMQDPLGRRGKFTKFKWDVHNAKAVGVDYLIYANFDNNLTETIVIDGTT